MKDSVVPSSAPGPLYTEHTAPRTRQGRSGPLGAIRTKMPAPGKTTLKGQTAEAGDRPTDPTKALHPEHVKTHQVAKRQTTQLQKVGRRREQTLQQACTLAANGHGRRRTLSGQKPRALEAEPRTRTHVPATCAAADGRAAGTSTSETAASVCVKWAHWRPRDSIPRHRQQKCTHVYTQRHVETVTALSCGLDWTRQRNTRH